MKKLLAAIRMTLVVLIAGLSVGMTLFTAPAQAQTAFGAEALVRVELKVPIQTIGLPIYGHLRDEAGAEYALVIAPLRQVSDTGLAYQILDDPASPGTYYLARERRKGARQAAAGLFKILTDDGQRLLVQGSPGVADQLSRLGFDVKAIPVIPMVFRTPPDIRAPLTQPTTSRTPEASTAATPAVAYDSRVAAMISQVQANTLYEEIGRLSGENTATIGGSPYTITTRHTSSGAPIQKATQYVYERMEALGLAVSYQDWSKYSYASRNVVGTKTGKTKPTEIVLITAHLDDTAGSNTDSDPAPGADDNASGSAALLTAAGIMAPGAFERTLRFVFFTGEEQGLYGSSAYADAAVSASENIVAVYNMDMIAWNTVGSSPELRLYTRGSNNPGYGADMAIAGIFSDVVAGYGLSSGLTPLITPDNTAVWSDHASFWDKGYAAIVAIEEDLLDFNPYYHTANDTRQRLNMPYFTHFTKASVGTAAHLALPTGLGDVNFDGWVNLTDAVLALQVISGVSPQQTAYKEADVNGDGKIGLAEAIYVLQKMAGSR